MYRDQDNVRRKGRWKSTLPAETTFEQAVEHYRMEFTGADANDLILQMRTWQSNDVGKTSLFHGDQEAALRSIRAPVLYMPSATDLYFPVSDARYEASFIRHAKLIEIPSLWGHTAGAGLDPEDGIFLNKHIAAFMDELTSKN